MRSVLQRHRFLSVSSQGTQLRYQNFGAAFVDSYCQSCHSSQSIDRQGAPGEFIFDTVEQIQRHRARIFVRSAADNDSMPPGPNDPSKEQRKQLAEWLALRRPQLTDFRNKSHFTCLP